VRVRVLGTACPLRPGERWSSFVVDDRVLLEAPPTAQAALHAAGLIAEQLDAIVISHLHGDHIAGLPFLLLEIDLAGKRSRDLVIAGPPGLRARVEGLFELLYPGWVTRPRDFAWRFIELRDGDRAMIGSLEAVAHEVDHGLPEGEVALGFRLTTGPTTLGFTGDSRLCDPVFRIAHGTAVSIVDCTFEQAVPGSTHMTVEDIHVLRRELAATTQLVVTHRGFPRSAVATPGVSCPEDLAVIDITHEERS
jgi:ribonuclease BN (tRNA processing enzyme)